MTTAQRILVAQTKYIVLRNTRFSGSKHMCRPGSTRCAVVSYTIILTCNVHYLPECTHTPFLVLLLFVFGRISDLFAGRKKFFTFLSVTEELKTNPKGDGTDELLTNRWQFRVEFSIFDSWTAHNAFNSPPHLPTSFTTQPVVIWFDENAAHAVLRCCAMYFIIR